MSDTRDIELLLQERLAKQRMSGRKEFASQLGDQILHWVAMLPSWTVNLAVRHGLLDGPQKIAELLEVGSKHRLLRLEPPLRDVAEVKHFWVPTDLRRELLHELSQRPPPWSFELARKLRDDRALDITRQTRAWAKLFCQDPWQSDELEYEKFVSEVVDKDISDLGLSAGDSWVDALEDIAMMAPEWVKGARSRLRRRLNLAYRIEQDERRLRDFVSREEQMPTIRRLLAGDGGLWCVHFLGVGGVGKTVLMRYLTARGPKEFDYRVARVDFDYLSPDYPHRDPGALLATIASELLMHSTSRRLDNSFDNLDGYRKTLEARMARNDADQSESQLYRLTEFEDVRREFITILKQLQKVLIIFDTCEELEKAHPYEPNLPSLEMTFQIIEELHKEVPSLRVVFAGRRPLARSGGQDVPDEPSWKMPGAGARLPEKKEYLALRVMRGFTETEAHQFIDQVKKRITGGEKETEITADASGLLTKAVREKILQYSPELIDPPEVQPPVSSDEKRFNPFDLHLFTNWILDDPDEAVRSIESGEKDVYTRKRIIKRLEKHVQPLVPLAVILRRFDRDMLAATDLAGPNVEQAFRLLTEQEWIHLSGHGQTETLTVDRNLLPRLDDFYHPDQVVDLVSSDETVTVEQLGHRIATGLAKLAEKRDVTGVDRHFVDVILRRQEPRAASEFWDSFCMRLAASGDWPRLADICSYLLGSEGALGEKEDHPLRAAVQAAMCSAVRTDKSQHDVAKRWNVVLAGCRDYPDTRTAIWLKDRAELGQPSVATHREIEPFVRSAVYESIGEVLPSLENRPEFSVQLIASFLAAVTRELDACERDGRSFEDSETLLKHLRMLRGEIESRVPRDLKQETTQALSQFCRAQEFRLDPSPVVETEEELERLARVPCDPKQCWFDLIVPDDIYARAALEFVRHVGTLKAVRSETLLWETLTQHYGLDTKIVQPNVERERLLSALLQLTLQYQPVAMSELQRLQRLYSTTPPFRPTCFAHESVGPIQIALAEALADMGAPLEAARFLDDFVSRQRQAIDERTRLAISRLRLRICRRYRLHHELTGIESLLGDKQLRKDALAATLTTLPVTESIRMEYENELARAEAQPSLSRGREGPRVFGQAILDSEELKPESPIQADTLREAVDSFRSAGDVFGELRAVTLQCMSYPTDGTSLDSLRECYEKVHSGLNEAARAMLPDWHSLQELASTFAQPAASERETYDDIVSRNLVENPVLGGWLLRIMALLISSRPSNAGRFGTRFDVLLKRQFPNGLPIELNRVLRKRAISRQTPWRRFFSTILTIAEIIVAFAIAIGVFAGIAYVIYYLGKTAITSSGMSSPPAVVFFCVFGLVPPAFFLFWIWKQIKLRITIRDQAVRDSSTDPTPKGPSSDHHTVELNCAIETAKLIFLPTKWRVTVGFDWPLRHCSPWSTTFTATSEPRALLDPWEDGKRELGAALKRGEPFNHLTVELDLPNHLAEWSWESAVRGAMRLKPLGHESRDLSVVRIASPLPSQKGLGQCKSLFLLEGTELAEQLNSSKISTIPVDRFIQQNKNGESEDPLNQAAVVIYGKAFQEPDGFFLRLGEARDGGTSMDAIEFLEPRQCARAACPLVILVGAAVDMDRRFDTDRRQAALLRRAGADAFHAGIETVIVIPSMPKKATIKVIEILASSLPVSRIERLLRALRHTILFGRPDPLPHFRISNREWASELVTTS